MNSLLECGIDLHVYDPKKRMKHQRLNKNTEDEYLHICNMLNEIEFKTIKNRMIVLTDNSSHYWQNKKKNIME